MKVFTMLDRSFPIFLTTFTKDVKNICKWSLTESTNYTHGLIFESLAELGDQSALAFDNATEFRVNLNSTSSLEWIKQVKPINFRSMIQTFSKYHLTRLGIQPICNNSIYPKDRYEQLVDNYGLLLFDTYNNNGSGITTGHQNWNQTVKTINRLKTVLVSKENLGINTRENNVEAFIIDDQEDIFNSINSLLADGQIPQISTQIDENFGYNNGNAQISPGEIIGLTLNLYNKANATIAGVQVLANDWDHTKNNKPCNNFEDNWPLSGQGAADLTTGEGH